MRLYCDIGEGELVELGMVKTIGKGDIVIRTKSVYHMIIWRKWKRC